VVNASRSVASALSSGTVESDTVFCPVGSVPATEMMRWPDTVVQLARTSVSVSPETRKVPLVVTPDARANAAERSTVRRRPTRCDTVTGTVHSTTLAKAKPDPNE